MDLVRIPVQAVMVSSGKNPKNIVDHDDPGQTIYWHSTPPGGPIPWAEFDLGQSWTVSLIWMLQACPAVMVG